MYSVSFIFEPGTYDARFHELNALIDAAAKDTPGYVGVESWRSADGLRANATYYWASLEALREFSSHPKHIDAKRQYQRWYRGYHIVIAEVVRSYGDGAFEHFTPNTRASRMAPQAIASAGDSAEQAS
jgi:heme-degrading monooxygenase HmoA